MLEKLKSFIESHQLLDKKDKIAIAVSGGRDSVAACHLFDSMNRPFFIIHCNFNLRGKESDDDESFVRQLLHEFKNAAGLEVKQFYYSENQGLSIQEWARRMRYACFQEFYEEGLFSKLVLAHHKDDERETFFINMVRGSGVAGLKSIPLQRDYIIRPMMAFSRREIDDYIREQNIAYREDSSNAQNKYLRNRLRNLLIPALDNGLPEWRSGLDRSIAILKEEHELMSHLLSEIGKKCVNTRQETGDIEIDTTLIATYPQGHLILYAIVDNYGFSLAQCRDYLSKDHSGAIFHSADYELLRDRGLGILRRKKSNELDTVNIAAPGSYKLDKFVIKIESVESPQLQSGHSAECIGVNGELFPLELRFRRKEDRIVPLGMSGSKLLSDYFIDRKIAQFEKDRIPLLCKGNKVLLVAGYGISEELKVKPENTALYLVTISRLH